MKVSLPLTTILILAAMSSCSKEQAQPSNTIDFDRVTGSYTYRLTGSAGDFDRDSDLLCYDSASMVFPTRVLDRDIRELQDSILSASFDTVAAPSEAMRTYFARQAGELGYKAAPDTTSASNETRADGLLLIDAKAVCLSAEWLTYCVTKSINMPGAAHGLTTNRYFNYAVEAGRLIKLRTIFTAEGLEALPKMIAAQAGRLRSVLGPTSIDALPTQENFIITPEGTILFAYQPYEAASYAQGEIRVPFYPYQLSELMTAEGLRLFHLGEK